VSSSCCIDPRPGAHTTLLAYIVPRNDTVLVRGRKRRFHEETYVCDAPLVLYEPPTVAGNSLLLCNNCGTQNAPEEQG
jgi:hypothetical protein